MNKENNELDIAEVIIDDEPIFFKPDGPLKNEMTFIYVSGVLVALWSFVWIGLAANASGKSDPEDIVSIWEKAQDRFDAWGRIGFLLIALFVSSQIVWSYKAYRFTEDLAGTNRKWRRGWSIGGWFTPIGNLFIPFLVIRETESIIVRRPNRFAWAGLAWFSLSWIAVIGRRAISEMFYYDGYSFDWSNASTYYMAYCVTGLVLVISVLFAFIYFGDISLEAMKCEPESNSSIDLIKVESPISGSTLAESGGSLVEEQIRMLGKLHAEGLLSDAEFAAKKADLLGRI